MFIRALRAISFWFFTKRWCPVSQLFHHRVVTVETLLLLGRFAAIGYLVMKALHRVSAMHCDTPHPNS